MLLILTLAASISLPLVQIPEQQSAAVKQVRFLAKQVDEFDVELLLVEFDEVELLLVELVLLEFVEFVELEFVVLLLVELEEDELVMQNPLQ